jgi:uncharacterized protein (DUF433 family)
MIPKDDPERAGDDVEKAIHWQDYVHTDARILNGKPVIRGTRISIEFLMGLFAEGWSEQQILDNYPQLNSDALRAAFAFAAECFQESSFYALHV